MHNAGIEKSRPRRVPYRLLSLLASGLLLVAGAVILYEKIDWHEVTAVWTNLDPKLVALAVAIYWLVYPINTFRFHRVILWTMVRAPENAPSLRFLFKLTCSAGFLALAAPVGLASDAAKVATLRLFGDLSVTDSARCALFDRVVGVQWIAIIGLATLPLQWAAGIEQKIVVAQVLLFAGLIAGVGVVLILPRLLGLIRHQFIDRLARVFVGYRAVLSPQRSAIQLIIGLLNLLCGWGTLYLLFRAAGLNVDPWIVGGFTPLLQLINSLPFLYMGWGGRELAMAATLGAAGNLTESQTLAVSAAFGAVLIMTSAVNGLFLIGDWRKSGQSPGGVQPAGEIK
ncbi:MAG: lysylphosphatidylglycerol synthase transmembrane domain-containing protein [Alphaproteobacteria bacterium]